MAAQSIIAGGLVKVLRLFEIPYEIRHFGSKVFRTQMDIAIINFDAGIVVNQETTLFFKRVFESENKITVLGCDKALKRCTNFMSMGRRLDEAWLAENRAEVCRKCQTQQRVLKESQNLYLTSALDGLTDEQRKIISDLKQYKAFDISRLMALEYQGAPLGRLAFYDFSMLNKLSDKSTLSESQYAELLEHLSDAFHVWNFVGRAVSERHFDTALYINGNYSLNSVARERFKKAGIPCWSVEFSFSYSDTEKVVYLQRSRNEHSRDWEALTRVRDSYRCRLEDCRKALDGFRNRIYGVDFNSYSSPARTESWDKFDRFKSGYKEVVSIFVSSGDELQVHEVVFGFVQDTRFFKSQGEWLRFLIANANPEVGYVIRMHPRLAPNKRDSVRAEEYDLLTEAASAARNLPNFLVIEPEDPISSYYILLHSVMSVVSWSMIA
ncbi:MAG: hypothetical protein ACXVCS_09575, partial [Bdellovibrionota bacterium]